MMKSNLRKRIKNLAVLGLVVTGLAATIGHSSDDGYEAHLRKRADRIFAYEKQHQALSNNRVYALSIALQFGDLKGAEVLVSSLEKQIKGI